jgi:excisionase family DNA binding protein
MENDLPRLLTKEQVAEMLECEPLTVEEKARTGELPAIKIGRSWKFPREALFECFNKMALEPKQTRAMGKAREEAAARKERMEAENSRRRKVSPLLPIVMRSRQE